MALIRCEECGRKVSDRAVACPGCGAPVSAAAGLDGLSSSVSAASPPKEVWKRRRLKVLPASERDENAGAWKTSVSGSLLGAFVGFPVMIVLTFVVATLLVTLLALTGASVNYQSLVVTTATSVFLGLTLAYAAKFYPSLFTAKPRLKSRRIISFLNLVFGWFVFGLLWNRNLTKKSQGRSHKVLIAMAACMLAYMIASMVVTLGIGLTIGKAPEDRVHSDSRIEAFESNAAVSATTFIDSEAFAAFDVPADWLAMPPLFPDADVEFSDAADAYSVSYGSQDYWNEMPSGDRRGLEPSDVNMDYFTKAEVAELLEVQAVEKVVFNSAAYGTISFFKYAQDGGNGTSQVRLFRIDDGYVYTLKFSGPTHHYNDEFFAFVGSLVKVTRSQQYPGLLNMGLAEPRAPWEQITAGEFPTEVLPWFTDRVLRGTPYCIPGLNLLAVSSRWLPLLQGLNVDTYDPASGTYAAVPMTNGQQLELLFGP